MGQSRVMRFTFTKAEIREFAARMTLAALQKLWIFWILFILYMAGELIMTVALQRSWQGFVLSLISGGSVLAILLVVMYLINYCQALKAGMLEPAAYWIEDGCLCCEKNRTRIPCSDYVRRWESRHLIVLGWESGRYNLAATPIPKRVFGDKGEMEAFLSAFCPAAHAAGQEHAGGGRFNYYFRMDPGSWTHAYIQMLQAVRVLRAPRIRRIRCILFFVLTGFYIRTLMTSPLYGITRFIIHALPYLIIGIVIYAMGNPWPSEKAYARFSGHGRLGNDGTGIWEMAFMDETIRVRKGQQLFDCSWQDYAYLMESDDTFFLVRLCGVLQAQFLPVPKWVFSGPEEMQAFARFCGSRGVTIRKERIQTSLKREKGKWIICGVLLLVLVVFYAQLRIAYSIAAGSVQQRMERLVEDGSLEKGMEMEKTGQRGTMEAFVFDPADYPDYVPIEIQVEVLKSLGIDGLEEGTVEEYKKWMEQDPWSRAFMEGYPYYSLLSGIGSGEYDEETYEKTGWSGTVYWFDFEGWDISEDYIDIMKGVQAIGGDDFILSDMEEDTSGVDWENGTGTIDVTFTLDGRPLRFCAEMENDWIDSSFLQFLGRSLMEGGKEKRLYYMGDNGQGAILFYNTPEWAAMFQEKTGIELLEAGG